MTRKGTHMQDGSPSPETDTEITLSDLLPLLVDPLPQDVQLDLDDLVHEAAEEDEEIDTSGVEDEDDIRDMRSRWASELNNQGAGDQLRYLEKQGFAAADVAAILAPAANSNHAAMTLRALIRD